MSQIPAGWTDSNTILTAPNGIQVVLGFRDYVLGHNWEAANWPLEPEHHATPVELSHPSLGGGQEQLFRWKRLEYTAAMGIFEGWLGQELFFYQRQYELQLNSIANLQPQLDTNTQAQELASLEAKITKAVAELC